MTTEDDIQAALDRRPSSWQTRLVLADFLDDRDDPRGEGYRALGVLRRKPLRRVWYHHGDGVRHKEVQHRWRRAEAPPAPDVLPSDWFDALPGADLGHWVWTSGLDETSRREAEDAAALAFAQLPAVRRAELLAVAPDK